MERKGKRSTGIFFFFFSFFFLQLLASVLQAAPLPHPERKTGQKVVCAGKSEDLSWGGNVQ